MGFLDDIVKAGSQLLGGSGQGSGLMEQVLGIINDPRTGGLPGLVEMFRNKGLGDAVSSWIGTGENSPVSGDEVAGTFGSDRIGEIARGLGVSESEASQGLADLLPQVIDRLTPDGTVPEGGLLDQALDMLKQRLSG